MKSPNARYLTLLATPLMLGAWLGYILYQDTTSTVARVAVEGYDPRDLLHGHYINLRISLPENTGEACPLSTKKPSVVWLCLDTHPLTVSHSREEGCTHTLKATCSYGTITTNLTKFFIPEYVDSYRLDQALREGKGSADILLSPSGNGRLKHLFIENQPWSDWLETESRGTPAKDTAPNS